MRRSISMALVVGALALGAGCEQMERGTEETGEGLERGAESVGQETREGFGELGDEAREGRETVERDLGE
jgi:hypothetical protein